MHVSIQHYSENDIFYRRREEVPFCRNAYENGIVTTGGIAEARRKYLTDAYESSVRDQSDDIVSIFVCEAERGNPFYASGIVEVPSENSVFIVYAHASSELLAARLLQALIKDGSAAPAVPAWDTTEYDQIVEAVFDGDEAAEDHLLPLKLCAL